MLIDLVNHFHHVAKNFKANRKLNVSRRVLYLIYNTV